jgi:hypothetical protein
MASHLTSALILGYAFDGRPQGMGDQALLHSGVHRCERCGYCASSLSDEIGPAQRARMQQADYRSGLNDAGLPALAREYRAAAQLAEAGGQAPQMLRHLLAAAWACDDALEDSLRLSQKDRPMPHNLQATTAAAQAFRVQAASLLEKQCLAALPEPGAALLDAPSWLQWIEVCRRAGLWSQAEAALAHAPHDEDDRYTERLRDAFTLMRRLVRERDSNDWPTAAARQQSSRAERYAREEREEHERRAAEAAERLKDPAPVRPPVCAQAALALCRAGEGAGRTAVDVIEGLPIEDVVKLLLRCHAQAGHWPGPPFLAALARALHSVLELALNDDDLALLEDQAKGHGALVSYLTAVIGQSTPTHWHHNPPPESTRPVYPRAC